MQKQIKKILFFVLLLLMIFNVGVASKAYTLVDLGSTKGGSVTYPYCAEKLKVGNRILIDDGKVELTELYKQYWDGPSFLAFYNEIKEQCNITDDEMNGLNFPYYTINSILYMEEIVPKYMMQYEINIRDLNIREISEPNTINLSYSNSKESQLIMIETLLDYIGG